jgi:hypothetical protein
MGNRDGEEDLEAAPMDERGYSYTEGSCAREGKDNRDRAQIETDRRSHASEGNEIGCDAGRWSRKQRGVKRTRCIVKGQIVPEGERVSDGCPHCDINDLVNERLDGQEEVDLVASVANLEEPGTWYYVVDCATCKAVIPFKHAPEDEPVVCFPTMRVRCLHCHADHAYEADLISHRKAAAPVGIFKRDRPPSDAGGGSEERSGGGQEDPRVEHLREHVILDHEMGPISFSLQCDNDLIVPASGKRATTFFLSSSFFAAGWTLHLALDFFYPAPFELGSADPAMLLEIAFSVTIFLGLVLFIFGMGSLFVDAFGFKRKVDELVLRICSSRLATGRIAVLGHTFLEKSGPIEGDSSTVGLVANSRQHQERR